MSRSLRRFRHHDRARHRKSYELSVERVEERLLLSVNTFEVDSTAEGNSSTPNTLYWAIFQSNNTAGQNRITFNISGTGVQTINLTTALPTISYPVTIDGTSQPGYTGVPQIELSGTALPAGTDDLRVQAPNTTIAALTLNGSSSAGIGLLSGSGQDLVVGCYIGTDKTGASAVGNTIGISIYGSSGNTIGGTTAGAGNVISGNHLEGIDISSALTQNSNLIEGNKIGTDVTGGKAIANGSEGILLDNTTGNTIGGSTAGAGNLISGNAGDGISFQDGNGPDTANLVQGNLIGTDVTGKLALPNTANGISINDSSSNTIGGTTSGARNVISGNKGAGIEANGGIPGDANTNVIEGNYIGTDVSGANALGNALDGIEILNGQNNSIGGSVAGAGNLISSNGSDGVDISGSLGIKTVVQGNLIGTDVTGTKALGNASQGIFVFVGGQATIGGSTASARNVIAGSGLAGIDLAAPGNVVAGNFVGTSLDGNHALPNATWGILLNGSGQNTIGGTASGAGNVVSGNNGDGIDVENGSPNNLIAGNLIGTNAAGTATLPNKGNGIFLAQAPATTIGGTNAGARNIISGNTVGIELFGESIGPTGSLIEGNYIGTDASGTVALGNGPYNGALFKGDGILLEGANNITIGGTAMGAGNLISGNLGSGVNTFDTSTGSYVIQRNLIGTNASGTGTLGNGVYGIRVVGSQTTTIGGRAAGWGNVIAGNKAGGIDIAYPFANTPPAQLVQGNFIGTDPTGSLNLGNQGDGITISSSGNTVGGTAAGAGNIIAFNTGNGIHLVRDVFNDPVVDNQFLSNSIFNNGVLGINLGNGPTPNHLNESGAAGGPNNYQNYPVLTSAVTDGTSTTSITGSLNAAANTTYTVQFFDSPSASASGYGQGKTLIGTAVLTTDSSSNAPINLTFPKALTPGDAVSATATDPSGDTSEFALDTPVQGIADLTITISPSPQPVYVGQNLTYTLTVTNNGPMTARGVTVTDLLPAGATYVSSDDSQGIKPTFGGGSVVAQLGTIAAHQTATVTIVVATPAQPATFIDSATVSTIDDDPTPANNTTQLQTQILSVVDLGVGIVAVPSPVQVGQRLTYTVTVVDASPISGSGVVVTDTLPANVTFVSASDNVGHNLTPASGTLTDNIGAIGANSTITITIVVIPTAAAVPSVTDSLSVTGNEFDSNTGNNSAQVTTTVQPVTDLSIAGTATPSTLLVGQDVTYTFTVTNNGPSDATGVLLTDLLPASASYVSSSSSQGTPPTDTSGTVTAPLGTIKAGASATVTIVVATTGASAGSLTDSASVSGNEIDNITSNNSTSVTSTVNPIADLALGMAGSLNPVNVGQPLTYTLTVTNNGPNAASSLVVSDILPANVTYNSGTLPGGTVSESGGAVTAHLASLANGASAVLTIIVTPNAQAAGSITNSATVSANENDPTTTDNSASVTTTVEPTADLAVAVKALPTPGLVGMPLTYTLTVTNNGPSPATNVVLSDVLDSAVAYVSSTLSQGTLADQSGDTLTFDIGTIAPKSAVTVTVIARPNQVATVSNAASVTEDEFDSDPTNDSASVSTAINPVADLAVSLHGSPDPVTTGKVLTYTLTVKNNGPSDATGVAITDTLPAGVKYVSTFGPAGSSVHVSGNTVTVLVATLADGASANVWVNVSPTTAGPMNDSATVSANEFDPNQLDNAAAVTRNAVPPPGTLQFASTSYSVAENGHFVTLAVNRTNGSNGTVSVHYATSGGNATPGVDYMPSSGTLVFKNGETTKTITVPVLADPLDKHDEIVNLVLSNPTGGAVLGTSVTAKLTIRDIDPNVTPPAISSMTLFGPGQTLTGISLQFTKPLNRATAGNLANYHLYDTGGSTLFSPGDPGVSLTYAYYNPSNLTVTLFTTAPLRPNEFYYLDVRGTRPGGVADVAGNFLAGNGSAGTDFTSYLARGTNLQYTDASGNQVQLRILNGGVIDLTRYGNGQGDDLSLVGAVPYRTILYGHILGRGTTSFHSITGLGQFGAVRVMMSTPPFYVTQAPFMGQQNPAARDKMAALSVPATPRRPIVAQALPRPR